MNEIIALIDKLERQRRLTATEFRTLLEARNEETARLLAQRANALRERWYERRVFIRGLIEFTNYCKNDCYYCGLRRSNACLSRYRLTPEEILECCQTGYGLGLRTFVLQGGEDPWYTPADIATLVKEIKSRWPDCALTLSLGEHSPVVYESWFRAGADRYLLRHETADNAHYSRLHPPRQKLSNRLQCLWDLKQIGYQVGCGFMVGSPGQGTEELVKDLLLICEMQPHMVGIGPFIPQKDTPFAGEPAGSVELTTYLLSIIRIMLPKVLLPATTALGTIHPQGRELGLLAGANVCMPNLSPRAVREKYALYDNKLSTGEEAVESLRGLQTRIEAIGYQMDLSRGDHAAIRRRR